MSRSSTQVVVKTLGNPLTQLTGGQYARVLQGAWDLGVAPKPLGHARDDLAYAFIDGWHPRSLAELELCAEALHRLHGAPKPWCTRLELPRLEDVLGWFLTGVPDVFLADLDAAVPLARARHALQYGSLARDHTIIHLDCHQRNWLIAGRSARLVDWDMVCWGPAAVDFAYLLWEVRRDRPTAVADRLLELILARRYCTLAGLTEARALVAVMQRVAIVGAERGLAPFAQYRTKAADALGLQLASGVV